MDLAEPKWRTDILAAVQRARAKRDFRLLESLLQRHMTDSFDALVQAIVRQRLDEAEAILEAKYPGSLDRQFQIEAALRGTMEGP